MARSTKFSQIEGNENQNYYDSNRLGYYSRTNVETLIDNFMIAYVGPGKAIPGIKRYEVAFWMQRCVQEFSYDIFHSEKSRELEIGPARQVVLPQDYVNYISVKRVIQDGQEFELVPAPRSTPHQGVVQDSNYQPVQDHNGEDVIADQSESLKRWQTGTQLGEAFADYYLYQDYDGDFHDNYYTFYGRKFGLTPSDSNGVGTFILDNNAGIIYLDSQTNQDDLVILTYISDGIENNDDLANVFIPKLAEDAVYANVLYSITKLMPSLGSVAGLYKKEAYAKMKNAKIRLMDLRPAEMKNVMRNKSKWIKH